MAHQIKGILFDVAGVLVALDGVPTMAKLLNVEPQRETLHAIWLGSPSVVAHETGKIDAATFAANVVHDLGLPVTPEEFLLEFCDWPREVMPGALELLDEIPDSYHVAALSNTSAVHWDKVQAMGLEPKFDKIFLSHRIGCLKPHPSAFLVALKGMGLLPSEVLFLDDGLRNVESASGLGMHAHVVRGPEHARDILIQYGIIHSAKDA